MQTTQELVAKALDTHPAPYWHKALGVNRNLLHNAKAQGGLSPSVAGAIALELGEDWQAWVITAALESAKQSACTERMRGVWRKRRDSNP